MFETLFILARAKCSPLLYDKSGPWLLILMPSIHLDHRPHRICLHPLVNGVGTASGGAATSGLAVLHMAQLREPAGLLNVHAPQLHAPFSPAGMEECAAPKGGAEGAAAPPA